MGHVPLTQHESLPPRAVCQHTPHSPRARRSACRPHKSWYAADHTRAACTQHSRRRTIRCRSPPCGGGVGGWGKKGAGVAGRAGTRAGPGSRDDGYQGGFRQVWQVGLREGATPLQHLQQRPHLQPEHLQQRQQTQLAHLRLLRMHSSPNPWHAFVSKSLACIRLQILRLRSARCRETV